MFEKLAHNSISFSSLANSSSYFYSDFGESKVQDITLDSSKSRFSKEQDTWIFLKSLFNINSNEREEVIELSTCNSINPFPEESQILSEAEIIEYLFE